MNMYYKYNALYHITLCYIDWAATGSPGPSSKGRARSGSVRLTHQMVKHICYIYIYIYT